MSDDMVFDVPEGAPVGFGVEDLPDLMRDLFLQCVGDARVEVDPQADFDGFIDALWANVSSAFGLTRRDWPEDAPRPWPVLVDEQRGVAEAVLEGTLGPEDLPG